jgi:hypothetical protein
VARLFANVRRTSALRRIATIPIVVSVGSGARLVVEALARRSGAAPAKGSSASLAADADACDCDCANNVRAPAKCLIVVARLDM